MLGRYTDSDCWALKNLSLTIREGEVVGLIGRNGSGKSTLARLINGVIVPDEGTAEVRCKSDLLSLGAGFVSTLTGIDNIFIVGAYLGYDRKYIKGRLDEIIEFTDIGSFIHQPLRTYSSGMRSRLAFAISSSLDPEILILDEVLSTGDIQFRKKAQKRVQDLIKTAKVVIVVSHQMGFIKEMATRVIWLQDGAVKLDGDPQSVIHEYIGKKS
ncbi:MAG: ABC transporter ATP-binding protein [Gammaproteobacteria bacterium]|nr:ABC transporter ATP-binding protein [Gammaproteobacteria bacterium]